MMEMCQVLLEMEWDWAFKWTTTCVWTSYNVRLILEIDYGDHHFSFDSDRGDTFVGGDRVVSLTARQTDELFGNSEQQVEQKDSWNFGINFCILLYTNVNTNDKFTYHIYHSIGPSSLSSLDGSFNRPSLLATFFHLNQFLGMGGLRGRGVLTHRVGRGVIDTGVIASSQAVRPSR